MSKAVEKNCLLSSYLSGVGRVVRRSRVNVQCRGVLHVPIWIILGKGPIALAVGAFTVF